MALNRLAYKIGRLPEYFAGGILGDPGRFHDAVRKQCDPGTLALTARPIEGDDASPIGCQEGRYGEDGFPDQGRDGGSRSDTGLPLPLLPGDGPRGRGIAEVGLLAGS